MSKNTYCLGIRQKFTSQQRPGHAAQINLCSSSWGIKNLRPSQPPIVTRVCACACAHTQTSRIQIEINLIKDCLVNNALCASNLVFLLDPLSASFYLKLSLFTFLCMYLCLCIGTCACHCSNVEVRYQLLGVAFLFLA